jgi:REP element-mobilizing transposase RayT
VWVGGNWGGGGVDWKGVGPLAYLVTFCCYASRLPGDERGYVDRRHDQYGTCRTPPNRLLRTAIGRRLPQAPFLLDMAARAVVEAAIHDQCARAGWRLHAVHVRTNHLHVVLTGTAPPERMMNQLKARATRGLREALLIDGDTRPWSQHGSTRYLWTPASVAAACHYVVEGQGPPLAGSPRHRP